MFKTDEQIVEAIRKKTEINRKGVIKYNLLLSLFFCLFIAGLVGMLVYYQKLRIAKAQEAKSKEEWKSTSNELEKVRERLVNEKNKNDSLLKEGEYRKVVNNIDTQYNVAERYAKQGYVFLRSGNFQAAKDAFNKSERANNGYKTSYEVYFLLWKKRDSLNDPDVRQRILEEVKRKYDSFDILKQTSVN